MNNQEHNSRPRRGRPPGANRKPLNQDERRTRNATYEKQRRELIGEGIARLEPLVGATSQTPRAEVIARTVSFIETARENIDMLRGQNEWLIAKIAEYQRKQQAVEPHTTVDPGTLIFHAPRYHLSEENRKMLGQLKNEVDPEVPAEIFEPTPSDPVRVQTPIPLVTPVTQVPLPWLEESPPSSSGYADDGLISTDQIPSLFPDIIEEVPEICDEELPPD